MSRFSNYRHAITSTISEILNYNARTNNTVTGASDRSWAFSKLTYSSDAVAEVDRSRFGSVSDNFSELDEADLISRKGLLGEIENTNLGDTSSGVNRLLQRQLDPLQVVSRDNSTRSDEFQALSRFIDQTSDKYADNAALLQAGIFNRQQREQEALNDLHDVMRAANTIEFYYRYASFREMEYQTFLQNKSLLDTAQITSAYQRKINTFMNGGEVDTYDISRMKRAMSITSGNVTGVPMTAPIRGSQLGSGVTSHISAVSNGGVDSFSINQARANYQGGVAMRPGIGQSSLSDIFGMMYDVRHTELVASMFQMDGDAATMILGIAADINQTLGKRGKDDAVGVQLQASMDLESYGITATNLANHTINRLKAGEFVVELRDGSLVKLAFPNQREEGALTLDDVRTTDRNQQLFRDIEVRGYRRIDEGRPEWDRDLSITNPQQLFSGNSNYRYQYLYAHEKIYAALYDPGKRTVNVNNVDLTYSMPGGMIAGNKPTYSSVTANNYISNMISSLQQGLDKRVVKRISISSANSTVSAEGTLKDPFSQGRQFNIGDVIDVELTQGYRAMISSAELNANNVANYNERYLSTGMAQVIQASLESQTTTLHRLGFDKVGGFNIENFNANALARRRTPNILVNDDHLRTLAVTLDSMDRVNQTRGANDGVKGFLVINAFDLDTGVDSIQIREINRQIDAAGRNSVMGQRLSQNLRLIDKVGGHIRTLAEQGKLGLVIGEEHSEEHKRKLRAFLTDDIYEKAVVDMRGFVHAKGAIFFDPVTGQYTVTAGSHNYTVAELTGLASNVSTLYSTNPDVIDLRTGKSVNINTSRGKEAIDSNKRLLADMNGSDVAEIESMAVPMLGNDEKLSQFISHIADFGGIDLDVFLNDVSGTRTVGDVDRLRSINVSENEKIARFLANLDPISRSIHQRRRSKLGTSLANVVEARSGLNFREDLGDQVKARLTDLNMDIVYDKNSETLTAKSSLGHEAMSRIISQATESLKPTGRDLSNLSNEVKGIVAGAINERINRGITLMSNATGTEVLIAGEGKTIRPMLITVEEGSTFRLGNRTYVGGQSILFSREQAGIAVQALLVSELERLVVEAFTDNRNFDRFGNIDKSKVVTYINREFNKARNNVMDSMTAPVQGEYSQQGMQAVGVLNVSNKTGLPRIGVKPEVSPRDPAFRASLRGEIGSTDEVGLFDLVGNKLIDTPITLIQQGARSVLGKVMATVNDDLKEGIGNTLLASQVRGMTGVGSTYRSYRQPKAGLTPEEEVQQQQLEEMMDRQFLGLGIKGGYGKFLQAAQRLAHRTKRIALEPVYFNPRTGGFLRVGIQNPIASQNSMVGDSSQSMDSVMGMNMTFVSMDPAMNDFGYAQSVNDVTTVESYKDTRLGFVRHISRPIDKNIRRIKDSSTQIIDKLGLTDINLDPYKQATQMYAKAISTYAGTAAGTINLGNNSNPVLVDAYQYAFNDLIKESQGQLGVNIRDSSGIVQFHALNQKQATSGRDKAAKTFAEYAYRDFNVVLPQLGEIIPDIAETFTGAKVAIKNPIFNKPAEFGLIYDYTETASGKVEAEIYSVSLATSGMRGIDASKGANLFVTSNDKTNNPFTNASKNVGVVFDSMDGGTQGVFGLAAQVTTAIQAFGRDFMYMQDTNDPDSYSYVPVKDTSDLESRVIDYLSKRSGLMSKQEAQKAYKDFIIKYKDNIVTKIVSTRQIKSSEGFLTHGAFLLQQDTNNTLVGDIETYLKDKAGSTVVDSFKAQIRKYQADAIAATENAINMSIKTAAEMRLRKDDTKLFQGKGKSNVTSHRQTLLDTYEASMRMGFSNVVLDALDKPGSSSNQKQLAHSIRTAADDITRFNSAVSAISKLSNKQDINTLYDIQMQLMGDGVGITNALMPTGTPAGNMLISAFAIQADTNLVHLNEIMGGTDDQFASGIPSIIGNVKQYMDKSTGQINLGTKNAGPTAHLGLMLLANLNIRQQLDGSINAAFNNDLVDINLDKAGFHEEKFLKHVLQIMGLDKNEDLSADTVNQVVQAMRALQIGFTMFGPGLTMDQSGATPLGSKDSVFSLSIYYSALETVQSRNAGMFRAAFKQEQMTAVRNLAISQSKTLQVGEHGRVDILGAAKVGSMINPTARVQQLINALESATTEKQVRDIEGQLLGNELGVGAIEDFKLAHTKALADGMVDKTVVTAERNIMDAAKKVGSFSDLAGHTKNKVFGRRVSDMMHVSFNNRTIDGKVIISTEPGKMVDMVMPDLSVLAELPGSVIGDKKVAQVSGLIRKAVRINEIQNRLETIRVGETSLAAILMGESRSGEQYVVDEATTNQISELRALVREFSDELDDVLSSRITQKKGLGRMGSAPGMAVVPVALRSVMQSGGESITGRTYLGHYGYRKLTNISSDQSIEAQLNALNNIISMTGDEELLSGANGELVTMRNTLLKGLTAYNTFGKGKTKQFRSNLVQNVTRDMVIGLNAFSTGFVDTSTGTNIFNPVSGGFNNPLTDNQSKVIGRLASKIINSIEITDVGEIDRVTTYQNVLDIITGTSGQSTSFANQVDGLRGIFGGNASRRDNRNMARTLTNMVLASLNTMDMSREMGQQSNIQYMNMRYLDGSGNMASMSGINRDDAMKVIALSLFNNSSDMTDLNAMGIDDFVLDDALGGLPGGGQVITGGGGSQITGLDLFKSLGHLFKVSNDSYTGKNALNDISGLHNMGGDIVAGVLRSGSPEGTIATTHAINTIADINQQLDGFVIDVNVSGTAAIMDLMTLPFHQGDYDGDMAGIMLMATTGFIDRKISQLGRDINNLSSISNPNQIQLDKLAELEKALSLLNNAKVSMIDDYSRTNSVGRFGIQQKMLESASMLAGYKVHSLGEAYTVYEFTRDQFDFYEKMVSLKEEVYVTYKDSLGNEQSLMGRVTVAEALSRLPAGVTEISLQDIDGNNLPATSLTEAYAKSLTGKLFDMMGPDLPMHISDLQAGVDIAKTFGNKLMGQLFDTSHMLFVTNTLIRGGKFSGTAQDVGALTVQMQTIGRTSIKARGESSIISTQTNVMGLMQKLEMELDNDLSKFHREHGMTVGEKELEDLVKIGTGQRTYLAMSGYGGYLDYIDYMYGSGQEFRQGTKLSGRRALTMAANVGLELGLVTARNSTSSMVRTDKVGGRDVQAVANAEALAGLLIDTGYLYRGDANPTQTKTGLRQALSTMDSFIREADNRRRGEPQNSSYDSAFEYRMLAEDTDSNMNRGFSLIDAVVAGMAATPGGGYGNAINGSVPSFNSLSPDATISDVDRQAMQADMDRFTDIKANMFSSLSRLANMDDSDRLVSFSTGGEIRNIIERVATSPNNPFSQMLSEFDNLGTSDEKKELIGRYMQGVTDVFESAFALNYLDKFALGTGIDPAIAQIRTVADNYVPNIDGMQGYGGLPTLRAQLNAQVDQYNQTINNLLANRRSQLDAVLMSMSGQNNTPEEVAAAVADALRNGDGAYDFMRGLEGSQDATGTLTNYKETLTGLLDQALNSAQLQMPAAERRQLAETEADRLMGRTDRRGGMAQALELVGNVNRALSAAGYGDNQAVQQAVGQVIDSQFNNITAGLESSKSIFGIMQRLKNSPDIVGDTLGSLGIIDSENITSDQMSRLQLQIGIAAGDKGIPGSVKALAEVMSDTVRGRIIQGTGGGPGALGIGAAIVQYEQDIEAARTQYESAIVTATDDAQRRVISDIRDTQITSAETTLRQTALTNERQILSGVIGIASSQGAVDKLQNMDESIRSLEALQEQVVSAGIDQYLTLGAAEMRRAGDTQSRDVQQLKVDVQQRMQAQLKAMGVVGGGAAMRLSGSAYEDTVDMDSERTMGMRIGVGVTVAGSIAGLLTGLYITRDQSLGPIAEQVFMGAGLSAMQALGQNSAFGNFNYMLGSSIMNIVRADGMTPEQRGTYMATTMTNMVITNVMGDVIQRQIAEFAGSMRMENVAAATQRNTARFFDVGGGLANTIIGGVAGAIITSLLLRSEQMTESIQATSGMTMAQSIEADISASESRMRLSQAQAQMARGMQSQEVYDEYEEAAGEASAGVVNIYNHDGMSVAPLDIATMDVGKQSLIANYNREASMEEYQYGSTFEAEVIAIRAGNEPTSEIIMNYFIRGDGLEGSVEGTDIEYG